MNSRRNFLKKLGKGLIAGAVAPTLLLPKVIEIPKWKRTSVYPIYQIPKGYTATYPEGYMGIKRGTYSEWFGNLHDGDPQSVTLEMLQKAYAKIMETPRLSGRAMSLIHEAQMEALRESFDRERDHGIFGRQRNFGESVRLHTFPPRDMKMLICDSQQYRDMLMYGTSIKKVTWSPDGK